MLGFYFSGFFQPILRKTRAFDARVNSGFSVAVFNMNRRIIDMNTQIEIIDQEAFYDRDVFTLGPSTIYYPCRRHHLVAKEMELGQGNRTASFCS